MFQENEKLRALVQKRGGYLPSSLDVTREVDQRLRNLEDFCQKISDREIDRYVYAHIQIVIFVRSFTLTSLLTL